MKRFWRAVGLGLAVLVGLILGVALTYLTVVLPRSSELERVASRFEQAWSTGAEGLRATLGGDAAIALDQEKTGRDPATGNPIERGRTIVLLITAPNDHHDGLIDAAQSWLQQRVVESGAQLTGQASTSYGDGRRRIIRDARTYTRAAAEGTASLLSESDGEKLLLVLDVDEW